MICELNAWTLFGKEDNIEKEKLLKFLDICHITIKLTTSSHLSYDLARLLEWFSSNDYNIYIDNRKDTINRDIIHFEVYKITEEE